MRLLSVLFLITLLFAPLQAEPEKHHGHSQGHKHNHDFSDADFLASYGAIVALLKAARLDALAVQEAVMRLGQPVHVPRRGHRHRLEA